MKKNFILPAILSCMFFACQNADLETAQVEDQMDEPMISRANETFDFTYKGVQYSSACHMVNDTTMVLEDKDVDKVYQELVKLPDLATYVDALGRIEYFDTYGEFLQEKEIKQSSRAILSTSQDVYLTLYDDKNYEGKKLELYPLNTPFYIPDLAAYGFNDIMSSFKVYTTLAGMYTHVITFYRWENYEGSSISFEFRFGRPLGIERISKYNMKGRKDWNDRPSALRILYIDKQ